MRGVILLLLLSLTGCGYHNEIRSEVPLSGQTIAIPIFENGTFEPFLEKRITESFKETFLRQGWRVVSHPDQAPLLLSGRMIRFDRIPISLDRNSQAQEYRIIVGLEYTFRPKGGEPPKQKDRVEASAEYLANPDPLADRAAEDRAIREAGQRLAERVADLRNIAPLPPLSPPAATGTTGPVGGPVGP